MSKKQNRKSKEFLARKYLDRQILVNTGNGYKKGRCTNTEDGLVHGWTEDGDEFRVSCKKVLLA